MITALVEMLLRPHVAARNDLVGAYESAFSREILRKDLPAVAFWRGRVALWAILRALSLPGRGEVVLPAYTCEAVPIALKFAGARCAYVDAEPRLFGPRSKDIRDALAPTTGAVLCQHTYGIPQPAGLLAGWVAESGAVLVEDCCQLVICNSHSGRVTCEGAASFFSGQWNKPFSTGLGGMAVFADHELYLAAKKIRDAFPARGNRRRAWLLVLQLLLHGLAVRPRTWAVVGAIYRRAQRLGWIRGTTTRDEYGDTMPEDYLATATNVQAIVGMAQLRHWKENVRHRQLLTEVYLEQLPLLGVDPVPLRAGAREPALWAVPLLVENRDDILRRARWGGLPIATWFDHVQAHINPATAARYDYRPGQCPRSEWMFPREIHLLTAPWVSLQRAERAIALLKKHARFSSV